MVARERQQPEVASDAATRQRLSRRRFLSRSGLAVASVGVGALAGCADERQLATPQPRPPEPDVFCALGFFNAHEAQTVEALTGRILPGTPEDPGAREAGVVNYIDCLLAAAEGIAEPMYLMPPFPAPEEEDLVALEEDYPDLPELVSGGEPEDPSFSVGGMAAGSIVTLRDSSIESTSYGVIPIPKNRFDRYGYQSLLPPAELFRRGIDALDVHANARFGADFLALAEADQDAVVADLADDRAESFDVPSAQGFFELVRRHTIEGMFSDPMYGGNRNLVGWKLLDYPGAQRAYTATEVRDPTFRREPQGLAEMHRFNAGHSEHDEAVEPVAGSDRRRR